MRVKFSRVLPVFHSPPDTQVFAGGLIGAGMDGSFWMDPRARVVRAAEELESFDKTLVVILDISASLLRRSFNCTSLIAALL